MFKKLVLLMLGLTISLSACSSSQGGNDAGEIRKIKLPMGYIPNIQYAPFYVAVDKGYFAEEGIEIEFDYSSDTHQCSPSITSTKILATSLGGRVLLVANSGLIFRLPPVKSA